MTTKCKVDLCRHYSGGSDGILVVDNNCNEHTDITRCPMHQPDPRDKIIKDQAMRIIAQEKDRLYDTIVASIDKTNLTLSITTDSHGSHITLTGGGGTYGFVVGSIRDRVDYEQAMDKFNRIRRLANG